MSPRVIPPQEGGKTYTNSPPSSIVTLLNCSEDILLHFILQARNKVNDLMSYLGAYGHVCGVAESLFDGEAGDEIALLSDVPAALLKEAHRHGDPVEEDLSPGRALGAPRNDFQQRSFAATWRKSKPPMTMSLSFSG